jgi:hypothetical protein
LYSIFQEDFEDFQNYVFLILFAYLFAHQDIFSITSMVFSCRKETVLCSSIIMHDDDNNLAAFSN